MNEFVSFSNIDYGHSRKGQFSDGVRFELTQLTSMVGHFVCRHVSIGLDRLHIDFRSLSNRMADPLLYFI